MDKETTQTMIISMYKAKNVYEKLKKTIKF